MRVQLTISDEDELKSSRNRNNIMIQLTVCSTKPSGSNLCFVLVTFKLKSNKCYGPKLKDFSSKTRTRIALHSQLSSQQEKFKD